MDNINVRMNGKEYLDYKKSMGVFGFFGKPPSKNTKEAMPYLLAALFGIVLIAFLISDLTYVQPEPRIWGHSNIAGYKVHDGLIVWFAVAIGLAWIFHGFGFIIIKR